MKKFFMALIMFLTFISYVNAEVPFHNANQVTLTWDEVTTDIDGDLVPGVTYKLYLVNANTDPNKTNPVEVSKICDIQETITLSKGRYFVGVQACSGDLSSVINWGDELENQEDVDLFGIRFASPPHAPKNLKR